MSIKRKTIKRSTATMLLIWWWFNLLLAPSSALAQELTSEPTPTPEVQTTPEPTPETTPEPTIEPTTTPAPTETQVIDTGDAAAAATSETTANTNTTVIPGSVDTDGCGVDVETPCPEDQTITTDNTATTSAVIDGEASSGQNTATGSDQVAEITTGDAGAVSTADTTANTNIVELTPESTPTTTPTPTETPLPESTVPVCDPTIPEVTPTPIPEISITNTNSAVTDTQAGSEATTGGNQAESEDTAIVNTGDAGAITNVTNVLNTNIVGTDYQILSINITDENGEDIDLNQLWQQLLTVDEEGNVSLSEWPSSPNVTLTVVNNNDAEVNTTATATADTGNNQVTGENGEINTGDAVAVANVTNIINTNIIGSKFLLGNINILGSGTYNLILPRPEWFLMMLQNQLGGVSVNNTNQADVNSQVSATATTGTNQTENGNIGTGDALAVANSYSLINSNISLANWFYLILNNLGSWDGQVQGWTNPGATETAQVGTNIYSTNGDSGGEVTGTGSEISNANSALVNTSVSASANTGGNSGGNIYTGNALAAANLVNLVNTNIVGSRFFLGLVNILGNWGGKVIFAYPDVSVSMTSSRLATEPGDEVEYTLKYENIGYDKAQGVKLNLDLPKGMTFISSSGKLAGGCDHTYCSWEVGSLNAKASGELTMRLKVNEDFDFSQKESFFSKLIPTVNANGERQDKEIQVKATIATSDPESFTGNNSFVVASVVYEKLAPESDGTGGTDLRKPAINVSAWNNVNGYVYPKDTVTFVVEAKNSADVPANNTKLVHKLYGPDGSYYGSMLFEVGKIDPYKSGKISFGLNVPKSSEPGKYKTESYVITESAAGEQITSNVSQTFFEVKARLGAPLGETETPTEPEAEVLGTSIIKGPSIADNKQDLWIWVMLLMTSTVLLSNRLESKFSVKKAGWQ